MADINYITDLNEWKWEENAKGNRIKASKIQRAIDRLNMVSESWNRKHYMDGYWY